MESTKEMMNKGEEIISEVNSKVACEIEKCESRISDAAKEAKDAAMHNKPEKETYATKVSNAILKNLGMDANSSSAEVIDRVEDIIAQDTSAVIDKAGDYKDRIVNSASKAKLSFLREEEAVNELQTEPYTTTASILANDKMVDIDITVKPVDPEKSSLMKDAFAATAEHIKHDVIDPIVSAAYSIKGKFSQTPESNLAEENAPLETMKNVEKNTPSKVFDESSLKKRQMDTTNVPANAKKRLNSA